MKSVAAEMSSASSMKLTESCMGLQYTSSGTNIRFTDLNLRPVLETYRA